jgi:hypothetical protein
LCRQTAFVCFARFSAWTPITLLYRNKWLVFMTETECVYCAVRGESVSIIQVYLGFKGRVIGREIVSGLVSIPAESLCDLWWKKCHRSKFFSENMGFTSFCIILTMLCTYSHVRVALARRTKRAKPEDLPEIRENRIEKYYTLVHGGLNVFAWQKNHMWLLKADPLWALQ